ncbi:MAG TPA: phosphatase PAP2 family protein [Solirubrobacteraceae bacterium]
MRARRLLATIVELDCAVFDRVAKRHTPSLDRTLPRLTRAADHSLLWLAVAAVLAVAGGRRGQRAALRGVGSIAITSLLVNQAIKRLVRRPRPSLRKVPAARRLRIQPLTTSFPSGHAASAAAFATGVSVEVARARTPIGALAAAVGYSRTYVGVHYPLDVVVGATIGAAVGALTTVPWPVLPAEAEQRRSAAEGVRLPGRREGEGLTLLINPEAGSPLTTPSAESLRERIPRARIVEVAGSDQLGDVLDAEVERCAVLGVCGGDGTTVSAAEIAIEHDKPLLLIPTGTLNHLARDLRIESDEDALEALERGEALQIDVGEIDGRLFVNTACFGAYTEMLATRATMQKRIGRWPAQLAAVALTVFRADPVEVWVDGEKRTSWMVFIGNCRHEPSGFAPSWRPQLDDGLLDVRILGGDHPFARLRLLSSILAGRLTRCAAYDRRCVGELRVSAGRRALTLARDGDSFEGSGSFAVRKLPRRLVVYAPADRPLSRGGGIARRAFTHR